MTDADSTGGGSDADSAGAGTNSGDAAGSTNGDHADATSDTGGHRVTFVWRDGTEQSVLVRDDETVLDAGERVGAGLPFGCRTGACGTCVARLLEGDCSYRRPPRALKSRHRESGYVLTCVATPTAACRFAVGAHVQAEMVPNPWK